MNKDEILVELEKIFKKITRNDDLSITEKTTIGGSIGKDILQISSINFVEAIIEIEESFNIIIDFDMPLDSIGDIVNLIELGGNWQYESY